MNTIAKHFPSYIKVLSVREIGLGYQVTVEEGVHLDRHFVQSIFPGWKVADVYNNVCIINR